MTPVLAAWWVRAVLAAIVLSAVTVGLEFHALTRLDTSVDEVFPRHRDPVLSWPAHVGFFLGREDLTFDKTDEKDAVLIARLAAQLRCYVPETVDETWGRLRHLGARRAQLLVESLWQVQQMRALLECVWPAALQTARQPFRSSTWTAAMTVMVDRDGGDLARTRRLGAARWEKAVRKEIIRRGRTRPCMRIVRLLFAALSDPAGVTAHRPGALERVALILRDWLETHRRLTDTETRMTTILDELRLTQLVTSIPGPVSDRRSGDPGRDR